MKEIEDACERLKNRKSPGPDKVLREFLKYEAKKLFEHSYFNHVSIPMKFQNSRTKQLNDTATYRGWLIRNYINKFWTGSRLEDAKEEDSEKTGGIDSEIRELVLGEDIQRDRHQRRLNIEKHQRTQPIVYM